MTTTAAHAVTTPISDVDTREEVDEVVRTFYAAVAQDTLLGPIFEHVAQVDWPEHLPKISAFWCRVLFGAPGYIGNPYARHRGVHERSPFTAAHFDRWLILFEETLDEGWSGPNAEVMKELASNVARVHGTNLLQSPYRRSAPSRSPESA